jgi:hypothetical protein
LTPLLPRADAAFAGTGISPSSFREPVTRETQRRQTVGPKANTRSDGGMAISRRAVTGLGGPERMVDMQRGACEAVVTATLDQSDDQLSVDLHAHDQAQETGHDRRRRPKRRHVIPRQVRHRRQIDDDQYPPCRGDATLLSTHAAAMPACARTGALQSASGSGAPKIGTTRRSSHEQHEHQGASRDGPHAIADRTKPTVMRTMISGHADISPRRLTLIWTRVCQPGLVSLAHWRLFGEVVCGRLGGWRSGRAVRDARSG